MQTRTLDLAAAAALLMVSTSLPAADTPLDTGGACIPNATYAPSFGCYLTVLL